MVTTNDTTTEAPSVPNGCTGFAYWINSDAPDEGSDVRHDDGTAGCPVHRTAHDKLLAEVTAITEGMTALAGWHAEHPDIALVHTGTTWIVSSARHRDDEPAAITRALADGAAIGDVKKSTTASNEHILFIERNFGGGVKVSYQADREQVCERVVLGTETVEVPDPDAPKVTIEREIVEWRCEPILAGAAA